MKENILLYLQVKNLLLEPLNQQVGVDLFVQHYLFKPCSSIMRLADTSGCLIDHVNALLRYFPCIIPSICVASLICIKVSSVVAEMVYIGEEGRVGANVGNLCTWFEIIATRWAKRHVEMVSGN